MEKYSDMGKVDIKKIAGRIAAGLLGLVFLASGVLKGMDMTGAVSQAGAYEIMPLGRSLVLLVWLLTAAECALGASLLLYYRIKLSLLGALGLLTVFFAALLWAWQIGSLNDCGCFGKWVSRTPGEALAEDLIFLALWLAAWFFRSSGAGLRFSRLKAGAAALALSFAVAAPPLTGFSVERVLLPQAGPLEIMGEGPVDLSAKPRLIEIMDVDCGHCIDFVFQISELALMEEFPDVMALSMNSEQDIAHFREQYFPEYPIKRVGEEDFYRLLGPGVTPRFLLVVDGAVVRTWEDSAPRAEEVLEALNEAGGRI